MQHSTLNPAAPHSLRSQMTMSSFASRGLLGAARGAPLRVQSLALVRVPTRVEAVARSVRGTGNLSRARTRHSSSMRMSSGSTPSRLCDAASVSRWPESMRGRASGRSISARIRSPRSWVRTQKPSESELAAVVVDAGASAGPPEDIQVVDEVWIGTAKRREDSWYLVPSYLSAELPLFGSGIYVCLQRSCICPNPNRRYYSQIF